MATGMREVTFHLPEELADSLAQTAGRRAVSQDTVVEESLRHTFRSSPPDQVAVALERLIFALETSTLGVRLHRIPIPRAGEDHLSQLTRLRATHAAYSLAMGNTVQQEQQEVVPSEEVSPQFYEYASLQGSVDCIRGKMAYLTMQDSGGRIIEATYDAKRLQEQIGMSTDFLCIIVKQEPTPVVIFLAAEELSPTTEEILQRHEELKREFAPSRERWKKSPRK